MGEGVAEEGVAGDVVVAELVGGDEFVEEGVPGGVVEVFAVAGAGAGGGDGVEDAGGEEVEGEGELGVDPGVAGDGVVGARRGPEGRGGG